MKNQVSNETAQIIYSLYGNGRQNKAVLASLRSAKSMHSLKAQSAWPIIMTYLDDKYLSSDGMTTSAENAVFATLRMYAIHQQGNSDLVFGSRYASDKDKKGIGLFNALGQLNIASDSATALANRVEVVLSATNFGAVINALTHLVQILKGSKLRFTIDYANLAQELYRFQQSYEQANEVRMLWGQSFYRLNKPVEIEGENSND